MWNKIEQFWIYYYCSLYFPSNKRNLSTSSEFFLCSSSAERACSSLLKSLEQFSDSELEMKASDSLNLSTQLRCSKVDRIGFKSRSWNSLQKTVRISPRSPAEQISTYMSCLVLGHDDDRTKSLYLSPNVLHSRFQVFKNSGPVVGTGRRSCTAYKKITVQNLLHLWVHVTNSTSLINSIESRIF